MKALIASTLALILGAGSSLPAAPASASSTDPAVKFAESARINYVARVRSGALGVRTARTYPRAYGNGRYPYRGGYYPYRAGYRYGYRYPYGYSGYPYYYGSAVAIGIGLPLYASGPRYVEYDAVPPVYQGRVVSETAPRRTSRGSSGLVARDVQAALATRGYYQGPRDGVFGAGSQDALRRYQTENGVTPTGTINSDTLKALGLR